MRFIKKHEVLVTYKGVYIIFVLGIFILSMFLSISAKSAAEYPVKWTFIPRFPTGETSVVEDIDGFLNGGQAIDKTDLLATSIQHPDKAWRTPDTWNWHTFGCSHKGEEIMLNPGESACIYYSRYASSLIPRKMGKWSVNKVYYKVTLGNIVKCKWGDYWPGDVTETLDIEMIKPVFLGYKYWKQEFIRKGKVFGQDPYWGLHTEKEWTPAGKDMWSVERLESTISWLRDISHGAVFHGNY